MITKDEIGEDVRKARDLLQDAIESLTTYKELTPPTETRMANELLLMLRQSLTRRPNHN